MKMPFERSPIENWTTNDLAEMFLKAFSDDLGFSDLSVLKFDRDIGLFVGITRNGRLFLSGIPKEEVEEFSFESGELKSRQAIYLPDGTIISPVYILSCAVEDEDEIWAIASLFSGLANLTFSLDGSAPLSKAMSGLKRFFEERSKSIVPSSQEVGLIGELAVMLASIDIDAMVASWHSSIFSTFDFSCRGSRLEVKTSLSPTRLHWLKESQLSVDFSANVTYLSVYCPETAEGMSVHDCASEILAKLKPESRAVFVAKLEPLQIGKFQSNFDVEQAISSLRWVQETDVPKPMRKDLRILDMNWKCNFNDLEDSEIASPWDDLFKV